MALNPFSSHIITDTGISMGDEGKGRLIPEVVNELKEATGLASPVDIVLKVNGGANSGHSVGSLKLNLLPAGIVCESVPCLAIGSGVVADPLKFRWEIAYSEDGGFDVKSRLIIDERTMVSDVAHRVLDLAWESYRTNILGEEKRGSTGRGISPAFSEETSQWQIHYHLFRDSKEAYATKLKARLERAALTIQHVCQVTEEEWNGFFDKLTAAELRANAAMIEKGIFSKDEFDFTRFKGEKPFTFNFDEVLKTYWKAGTELKDSICDVRERCLKTLNKDLTIVAEFGQAFWLDKRFGFSPNVTASHTFTPEVFQSAGIPCQKVHNIGVCKAYDTKVGTHVFITEMDHEDALAIRLKKIEFGVSTGRQRMVGWYDAVEKGDALRYGGVQDICLNKLDVLTQGDDWKGNLKICTHYEDPQGNVVRHVPRDSEIHKTLKPVYLEMPGWDEDISEIRSFDALPENTRKYVAAMVKTTLDVAYEGAEYPEKLPNLRYLGVGPQPNQIIKDIPQTSDLISLI